MKQKMIIPYIFIIIISLCSCTKNNNNVKIAVIDSYISDDIISMNFSIVDDNEKLRNII